MHVVIKPVFIMLILLWMSGVQCIECNVTIAPPDLLDKKKIKLNPWRYSSEEPRPTEAFAARWQ